MAHQSFAKKVLETLQAEAVKRNGSVSSTELSHALFIQTSKDHKRMLNAVYDLVKNGRIKRISQGVYAPDTKTRTPDKREVMWRIIRMRKAVTLADLQELADVSKDYAKQWLAMLVRRGIAVRVTPPNKNVPHCWRLIKHDLAEMPVDTRKAEKLRELRKNRKKQILSTIDVIGKKLAKVRESITELEDE